MFKSSHTWIFFWSETRPYRENSRVQISIPSHLDTLDFSETVMRKSKVEFLIWMRQEAEARKLTPEDELQSGGRWSGVDKAVDILLQKLWKRIGGKMSNFIRPHFFAQTAAGFVQVEPSKSKDKERLEIWGLWLPMRAQLIDRPFSDAQWQFLWLETRISYLIPSIACVANSQNWAKYAESF